MSRPARSSKRAAWYDDYLCYNTKPNDPEIVELSSLAAPHQKGSSDMYYPIANYVISNVFSASHQHFLVAIIRVVDPSIFRKQ